MFSTAVKKRPSFAEFIVLVSTLMALTALSIDAMLPALAQIGSDLQVQDANDRQLVISMIFVGLSLGQLLFGPLSDSIGRKPAIFSGLGLYMGGALLSMFAVNFPMMLLGRFLQGIGASAPRAVTLALVRDQFAGREMARVMSFVMTVFILVPMLAPTMGQAILQVSSWRTIFGVFLLLAAIALIWLGLRQPETLAPENQAPFTGERILKTTQLIIKNRLALGYTVTAGLVSGAFIGYLNSAQQIFQEQYALGDLFSVYFGIIASSIGLASLLNSRLVMRFGMRFLVRGSLLTTCILSAVALGSTILLAGQLPFPVFMAYLMLSFFCVGVLFGNLNSLAMEPLGQMAGIGAAVVGSLSTFISVLLGTVIGQSYNGTIVPLLAGLAVLTGLSLIVIQWAEADR
ncbi:MAG: multidrug effflux MFS transporter [Anaerolineaceae bacterium]|nr:multidrug effflux MFS transporter [Anaerolineaceae bacterium]